MKYKISILTAAVVLIACLPALAVLQIDFQTAMELALKNNRGLKMLKTDGQYADLQVKEAYSAAYPMVNAIGSYSRNIIIPEMESDFVMNGEPMSFRMAMGRENNYFGMIELQQPLWIAGKIGLGVKIAKIYRQIADYGIDQGESDLKMLLTRAYYTALLAEEMYHLTVETESQISNHLKNAEAMYEEGVVSEYDKLRAEVELANFQPQVTGAEEGWKMAREALRIVIGLDPDEEFELTGKLEEEIPGEMEIDWAVAQALQNRADYKQLALQGDMFKHILRVEKRNQYWPNFFLSVGYQLQAQEGDFDFNDYFWGEGLSTGISVSIPLFDGFKTKNRIQMAKVNLKRQAIITSQVEEGIRMEVKTAVWQLEQAVDKLTASRQAVMQAEKGYAIAEVRYESGISTQVELLDVRLAQTQAQIGELSAKFDIIMAKAALERAMGR